MSAGVLVRRPVRGATALRGGRTWRPTPYQVAGFCFFLVMTLVVAGWPAGAYLAWAALWLVAVALLTDRLRPSTDKSQGRPLDAHRAPPG